MQEMMIAFFNSLHWSAILLIMIISIVILGKVADLIIDLAVILSLKWHIPKLIIGATVISLGTTLPEVFVSAIAALQGQSGIALGNAVGSIICDTGLILGLAIILGKIPTKVPFINRQGWIQIFAGIFLIFFSLNDYSWEKSLSLGGNFSQGSGIFFIILLISYIFLSIYWAKRLRKKENITIPDIPDAVNHENIFLIMTKLFFLCLTLAIASEFLILSATEIAERLAVPQSIIAVSLVALGTSIPELVTAIIAVRKGLGEIALGNVIGADILNALLVAGSAAALTPGGLSVDPSFFKLAFPVMFLVLIILRFGIIFSKQYIHKIVGILLLAVYVFMTYVNISEISK